MPVFDWYTIYSICGFFKKIWPRIIIILCWVSPIKKIFPYYQELELFINVFKKLKDLAKLFPRDVEEKQIRGVEDSGRKSNKAVFHIL